METVMQIGSRVRVISKNDIIYEGTFAQIIIDGRSCELIRLVLCNVYADICNIRYIPLVSFDKADMKSIELVEGSQQPSYNSYALQVSSLSTSSFGGAAKRKSNFADLETFKDYIGRSGDPKDFELLPCQPDNGGDYDFEKFNKLFSDLCEGKGDLLDMMNIGLSLLNDVVSDDSGNSSDLATESLLSKDVATTENLDVQRQQDCSKRSTAYDKSKSFFDTISSFATHRISNINPNWREKNIETFGAPMIYYERRVLHDKKNLSKLPCVIEEDENVQLTNFSYAEVLKYDNTKLKTLEEESLQDMSQLEFETAYLSATSTPFKN